MIIIEQPVDRHGDPNLHAGTENNALDLHLLDAPVDDASVEFEVGNPVAEQASDPVGLLEDRRRVAHARQLLSAGEPRGPRSDDGDALAGAARRALRTDPAFAPRAIGNLAFHRFDGDWSLVDIEGQGSLARRRPNA